MTSEIINNQYCSSAEVLESWPEDAAFISIASKPQLHNGRAVCTRLAVLNEKKEATLIFHQGEPAHFYFEFAILQDLEVPAGGVELEHESGVIVHGKNTFQLPVPLPERVPAGARIRFHQWIDLGVMVGRYSIGLGLAGTSALSYAAYSAGRLSHQEFHTEEHCRVPHAISLEVHLPESGRLLHHGLAELPGGSVVQVLDGAGFTSNILLPANRKQEDSSWPTVLHITHWKAGSQWIHKILRECAPDHIVDPKPGEPQVRHYPIREGYIYPTVYMAKPELDKVVLPDNTMKFVVIRDLRDTLISAYWSFKYSHPILTWHNRIAREKLSQLDFEDGMLYLMDHFLDGCAAIQVSWIESAEVVLKYEDLLDNDVSMLEHVLIDRCGLPLNPESLRQIVLASRFEAVTSGRKRGEEDRDAHERKGVAGDWRNHFTDRTKKEFKARFGGLLVAADYEKDLDW
jgi:lipopolysaccharide transport system ATP-binding protein